MVDWHYFHLASQTTVTVAPPESTLICVTVNKGVSTAAVTVFDGNNPVSTTASATIAVIDASAAGNFFYGNVCRAGITVTQATASADLTIIYALPEDGDTTYANATMEQV